MLVLSRHRDEVVMIGDDIEVVVVDVVGGKVRLGFKAPSNVKIHRLEVYEAIKRTGEKQALSVQFRKEVEEVLPYSEEGDCC